MTTDHLQGLDLIGFLISEITGVSLQTIKSPRRGRGTVHARALISKMARSQDFTFEEIGAWMNKDKPTIMYHMEMDV